MVNNHEPIVGLDARLDGGGSGYEMKCKWHSQLFLRAEPKQWTHIGDDDWQWVP